MCLCCQCQHEEDVKPKEAIFACPAMFPRVPNLKEYRRYMYLIRPVAYNVGDRKTVEHVSCITRSLSHNFIITEERLLREEKDGKLMQG